MEFLTQRRLEDALVALLQAVAVNGDTQETLTPLAEIYCRLDRREQALSVCDRLIATRNADPSVWKTCSITRRHFRDHEGAIDAALRAVDLSPSDAECHYELALSLSEAKRPKDAKAAYERAVQIKPDYAEARNNLGVVCQELEQWEEAARHLQEAVRLAPTSVSAYNNLGVVLSEQRRYDESIAAFHKVLALDPNYTIAWNNLANSLRAIGENEEAVTILKRVVQRKPDYAEAYNNLALVQIQLGRIAEAMENFDRALLLRPEYPECRVNRGMRYLLTGDFERGWTDYEWRWHTKHLRGRKFRGRKWDGSSLAGKRILLGSEQGLGDTFQFIRYALDLKQRGAIVIFEGQPEVRQLLARTPGIDEFVPRGEKLPHFDIYAPLLSLPGLMQTSVESIPSAVPYIHPDPDLVTRWKPRVKSLGGRLRVGIVWQGNPKFGSDNRRSTRLSCFESVAAIEGVRLVSLQRGFGSEQVHEVPFEVTTFAGVEEHSDGFQRTAAILQSLDLVIAVDTGVAHLAGAMGLPVWLIVAFANDWRWLTDRDDSPWYPTMRVFRQGEPGDWAGLFEQVATALKERLSEPTSDDAARSEEDKQRYERLLRHAGEASKSGNLDSAVRQFQEAADLDPTDWRAIHDLAITHAKQRQFEAAIGLLRRAVGLAPSHPTPYANLGLALLDNDQPEEAAQQLRRAIGLGGGVADVHNNLGLALTRQDDLPAAESGFLSALRLKPDYAMAHYNLAKVLLLQGKFEQGWLEYEWRDRATGAELPQRRGPRWAGEGLRGRTILLQAGADLQEAVTFLRFADRLCQGGARVLLECPAPLARIATYCPSVDQTVSLGSELPPHDVHCPLRSLPGILRVDGATAAEGFPYVVPHEPDVQRWRERLAGLPGAKVGILQGGGSGQRTNSEPAMLGLSQVIAAIDGITAVEVSAAARAGDVAVRRPDGSTLRLDLAREGDQRLADLAALVATLDLVICSDDLAAAVAGAMARPVYLLAGRWPSGSPWLGSAAGASVWYPMVTLVRPGPSEDWADAIAAVQDRVRLLSADQGYPGSSAPNERTASDPKELHASGVRHLREGRLTEAIDSLRRAVEADPSLALAYLDLGVAHARSGRLDLALEPFRQAANLDPQLITARTNVAQVLLDTKDFEGAARYLDSSLQELPSAYELRYRYGLALTGLGRFREAAEQLRHAATRRPDNLDCLLALGGVLRRAGQWEDAAASYRDALRLKPDSASALGALAHCLIQLSRPTEALPYCEDLVRRVPTDPDAHAIHGRALLRAGRAKDAARALQQVTYLRPSNPGDHVNLGKALLEAGQWDQGWLEMEWRLRLPGRTSHLRPTGQRWVCQPLASKTILFLGEDDDASTIQFLRLAKLAKEAGARVAIAAEPAMKTLLNTCDFIDEVFGLDDPLPKCDFTSRLMSAAIGFRIQPQAVPSFPKYLNPGPDPAAATADDEESKRRPFTVGITSECIGAAEPLLRAARDGLRWVTLCVREPGAVARPVPADGVEVVSISATELLPVGSSMGSFDALITSTPLYAHLAGALGIRTLAILPATEKWAWAEREGTTPWYPSTSIFWQESVATPSWVLAAQTRLAMWMDSYAPV